MEKLHIVTLNVNGLRTSQMKRKKFFTWLLTCHKPDIIMFQETHSSVKDEEKWSEDWSKWDSNIYYAHGETNSRGVCTLINPSLSSEIHQIIKSPAGRYIIMDISINNRRLTLVNIYAPNSDEPEFFLQLIKDMDDLENDDRIIAGDFNCVLNNDMDKKGGSDEHSNSNMSEMINTVIS